MAIDSNGKVVTTANELAKYEDYKTLFDKLNAIRVKHMAAGGVSDAQKTALSTAYTPSPAAKDVKAEVADVTRIKSALTNLESSPYLSNFASKITIPSVNDLLQGSLMQTISDTIEAVNGVCANCSHFTSASSQGNFGSHFTSVSSQGNFGSHFTSASSQGNFGSHFTSVSSQGNHSSYFTTNASNGNFSSNFTTKSSQGNYSSYFSTATSQGNFGNRCTNFTSTTNKTW